MNEGRRRVDNNLSVSSGAEDCTGIANMDKDDVIIWASTSPIANNFPIDDCAGILDAFRTPAALFQGWVACIYQCKSSVPPNAFLIRFLPAEVLCPTPTPCAPGYPLAPPFVRKAFSDPIPPDANVCRGIAN